MSSFTDDTKSPRNISRFNLIAFGAASAVTAAIVGVGFVQIFVARAAWRGRASWAKGAYLVWRFARPGA